MSPRTLTNPLPVGVSTVNEHRDVIEREQSGDREPMLPTTPPVEPPISSDIDVDLVQPRERRPRATDQFVLRTISDIADTVVQSIDFCTSPIEVRHRCVTPGDTEPRELPGERLAKWRLMPGFAPVEPRLDARWDRSCIEWGPRSIPVAPNHPPPLREAGCSFEDAPIDVRGIDTEQVEGVAARIPFVGSR